MIKATVLRENLAALAYRDPALAARIESIASSPRTAITAPPLIAQPARNDAMTLRIAPDGPLLHSAYDPLREAQTRSAALSSNATVVVLGLGAGHLPRAVLASSSVVTVIAAEPSLAAWHALLSCAPLSDLLQNEHLVCACGPDELRVALNETHVSAVRDGIGTAELPAWCEHSLLRPGFLLLRAELQAATAAMALDHGTMRVMGRVWFVHACVNLRQPRLHQAAKTWRELRDRCAGTEIVVAAAGPSLDTALAEIADRARSATLTLIATDTALGACLERGIMPTAVVSIDAQRWTYLHALGRPVVPTTLIADAAVAPTFVRRFQSWIPLSSGHPLTEHARQTGAPLLALNAPGRNVTGAALAVAGALSGRKMQLIGADFSYPGGTTYARGTYQHRLALLRASRTHPGETFFQEQLFGTANLYREPRPTTAGMPLYRSPLLDSYRDAAAQQIDAASAASAAGATHPSIEYDSRDEGWSARDWMEEHLTELRRLGEQLPAIPNTTTAAVVRLIGPIGRAYLPLVVWLSGRHRADEQATARLFQAWMLASTVLTRRFCR